MDNGARCGLVHVHLPQVVLVSQGGGTTKYCAVHLSAQGGTMWHVLQLLVSFSVGSVQYAAYCCTLSLQQTARNMVRGIFNTF